MTALFRTLVRPPAASSPEPAWEIPTLPGGEPGREAYALLGPAWRSSSARLVDTGHGFDVVRAPQLYASAALDQLRELGARRGAVAAEGDCWTFFVPPGSYLRPWPSYAAYLSGPAVWVPPRSARSNDLHMRWITREPTGHLLTDPLSLSALLSEES
ncbi:hypothetical protein ACWDBD_20010 [Streptomyces sp. NPDC001118]